MPLNECPVCGAIMPEGEGFEISKERVEHMKTHGYDFSRLLEKFYHKVNSEPQP